jgi:glycerol-3-phosphate dehydrogenase
MLPSPDRGALLQRLGRESFDVLVVGGGITGCGIARDAALRGMRTALVEKNDFASGTSSRSSRLVHGGIRYLEHGHLHLVFEASAERRRLLRLAPHLVRPLEFVWPVYEGARVPKWKLSAGLALYDALALFRNVAPHRRLAAADVAAREPRLRRDGLRGGARYFDAATDDARLTLANAIGAWEAGAVVLNHVELRGLRRAGDVVAGASVVDRLGGDSIDVDTRVIVNAAGPWSDAVRRILEPDHPARPAVRGSKGVHIAVPRDRIGNREAITLLSPIDGRVMFVLPGGPEGEQAIIGTTDTYTTSSPDRVLASAQDVAYLLDAANYFFPDAQLTTRDVVSSWAGIRPLISNGDGQYPTATSREHFVSRSSSGVVSITGGKLTTYRVMADDVLREVSLSLGRRASASPTRSAVLPGGDRRDVEALTDEALREIRDPEIAQHLVRAHGTRWVRVWEVARSRPDGATRLLPTLPYTVAELLYCVRAELACTIGDLLIRRTHLAFEVPDHGARIAERVAEVVGPALDWSAERRAAEVRGFLEELGRLFDVEPEPAVAI